MTDGDARDPAHGDDAHEHDDGPAGEHLDHLPDGSGCTEIWEHMADHRGREAADAEASRDGEEPADTEESRGGEEADADD